MSCSEYGISTIPNCVFIAVNPTWIHLNHCETSGYFAALGSVLRPCVGNFCTPRLWAVGVVGAMAFDADRFGCPMEVNVHSIYNKWLSTLGPFFFSGVRFCSSRPTRCDTSFFHGCILRMPPIDGVRCQDLASRQRKRRTRSVHRRLIPEAQSRWARVDFPNALRQNIRMLRHIFLHIDIGQDFNWKLWVTIFLKSSQWGFGSPNPLVWKTGLFSMSVICRWFSPNTFGNLAQPWTMAMEIRGKSSTGHFP